MVHWFAWALRKMHTVATLLSDKEYGNFELTWDWKVTKAATVV